MKRASYRYAIKWIAAEDDCDSTNSFEEARSLLSVVLIADLFDVDADKVAGDVVKARKKLDNEERKFYTKLISKTPYGLRTEDD